VTKPSGIVYLVGAGPGDPGLLTRRGAELLGTAEVVVYDGLVNTALLDLAPPQAERIYAGKKHAPQGSPLTQDQINNLLVARAQAGKRVVRLKGGDAFVFGRGAEECSVLARAGVRFEVVPGVTSATAVPAYAGIPLTARGVASTVAFATGHEAAGKPSAGVDWEALARAGTVVLFMALHTLEECCQALIAAGRTPQTPAAAIYWGTTARQHVVTSTLAELPAAAAGLRPPVLVIVGEVVAMRPDLSWYESRPLFGARVLVPRSLEQADGFARALAELGAEPVIMPVTRIAPPDDADRATIDHLMGHLMGRLAGELSSYHWILFTSGNAVSCFLDELFARKRDVRALASARIACVGKATARALARRGIIADVMPERGNAARVAMALLAAEDRPAASLRVLLPRAAQGRDEAVDTLARAGARVDVMPVYRSEATPPDDAALEVGLARLRAREIDAIAFFAPSQVQALADLLGPDATSILSACRVIATIGETTRAALTGRGVDVHVVASSPDAGLLAHEIASYYQRVRPRAG
jgi:uroporphyrinogen III methyltransferase/synthase